MVKLANFRSYLRATAALPFAMAALAAGQASPALAANPFSVLHTFQCGTDAGYPQDNLIADKAGNLYGTTAGCGANSSGTVFKLTPDGTSTVLYSFAGGSDGFNPQASLITDKNGNLYGTNTFGGANNQGDVFKIAPDGTETVLYEFAGGSDCSLPKANLTAGKKGALYGTTQLGGAYGEGTVFELTRNKAGGYTETVLYSFGNGSDGAQPEAGLIKDSAGNLYGTTLLGGTSGVGTVFKLASDGTETVLHNFTGYVFGGANDGAYPTSVIADKAGNLYGTTFFGGGTGCQSGCGTVFKIAPDGTETVLHSFASGSDGAKPGAGLFVDNKGNLYGTTESGGGSPNCGGNPSGCGTVFEVAPNGTETVLYSFTGLSDGSEPVASLVKDKPGAKGYLIGTTYLGGTSRGVVFEIGLKNKK